MINFDKIAKSSKKPSSVIFNYSGEFDSEYLNSYLRSIVCSENNCNVCNTCIKVNEQEYADIIYIQHDIAKNELEQVVQRFNMSAIETNGYKIAVFNDAEQINSINYNSLLKFIEEPPTKTHFVFITKNVEKILNTIRSRSMVLNVNFKEELNEELVDFEYDIKSLIALHETFKDASFKQIKDSVINKLKTESHPNEKKILDTLFKSPTAINKKLLLDQLVILLSEV